MTYYATTDSDGTAINERAVIRAFATEAEARAYIDSAWRDGLDEGERLTYGVGRFADCWIKTPHREDAYDPAAWAPFHASEIAVDGPHEHPGQGGYWITPIPPVMVAVIEIA